MADHARFEVKGAVVRVWTNSQRSFSRVTVDVMGERSQKVDIVAFRDAVASVSGLGAGELVRIAGNITNEKLKDKSGQPVKIDGYDKWVNLLVADKVTVETGSAAPAKPQSRPLDDSRITGGKKTTDDGGW